MKKSSVSINNASDLRLENFIKAYSDNAILAGAERKRFRVLSIDDAGLARLTRVQKQSIAKLIVSDILDLCDQASALAIGNLLLKHGLRFTEGDFLGFSAYNRVWDDYMSFLTIVRMDS
jgi:hypothetical protein